MVSSLTAGEREELPPGNDSLLNKPLIARLGISEKTFQRERSKSMPKMAGEALVDLARMAEKLQRLHPLKTRGKHPNASWNAHQPRFTARCGCRPSP